MEPPGPEFDALLNSLTEKLWRGELRCADTYLSEAHAFGPEAVVCVLAREAAVLGALSRIDPCNTPPAGAEYLDRLREILGDDDHALHVRLFDSLKTHALPAPADAGFRLGDPFSLAGSQVVLRAWLGSGGQGAVWAASLVGVDGEIESSTFAIKFEHQRHGPGWSSDMDDWRSENRWTQSLCFLPGVSLRGYPVMIPAILRYLNGAIGLS